MTTTKTNPKVLRAQMYKAFLNLAEADAALKQAERDETKLERPVIREDHNIESEGVKPCTAKEYVDQFKKQMDVMAKAFPEEGNALRDMFDNISSDKMAGKLGKFIAQEIGQVKELWEASMQCEFKFDASVRDYKDAGEMTYDHLLDLNPSKLNEADRDRILDDLKPSGALYKALSASDDIPSFYVLPEGLIAYNESVYEDGQPVFNLAVEHFEQEGITMKHFLGGNYSEQKPYGCDLRLITTDGVFPAPGTALDANPEDWLPTLKAQVMAVFATQSKDNDAQIEPR
jgi:hypothetical protein